MRVHMLLVIVKKHCSCCLQPGGWCAATFALRWGKGPSQVRPAPQHRGRQRKQRTHCRISLSKRGIDVYHPRKQHHGTRRVALKKKKTCSNSLYANHGFKLRQRTSATTGTSKPSRVSLKPGNLEPTTRTLSKPIPNENRHQAPQAPIASRALDKSGWVSPKTTTSPAYKTRET